LALYLTIFYPQYFSRVVLESASPGLSSAAERKKRRQNDFQLAEQLEKMDFREFLVKWYNLPLFQTVKAHRQFPELFARRLDNHPATLAKSLREMGTGRQPSLWAKLARNKIPLLLVVGEKDAKFRAIAEEMAQRNAACQVTIIKGCGHTVHLENAVSFVNCLKHFFV
jgi:2-succinyl-6-hydroxy-2,4-cyclohexadiene-1-carboxylate synthase